MKKDEVKTSGTKTSVSRRRLLTALTAGGAAAMTAPSEWTKPALKAVVMPAHAQTSPGGNGCRITEAWASRGNGCFCACVDTHADYPECGDIGTVRFINNGNVVATCGPRPGGLYQDGQMVSWSCSGNGATLTGASVTFEVEFSNGCICTEVVDAV